MWNRKNKIYLFCDRPKSETLALNEISTLHSRNKSDYWSWSFVRAITSNTHPLPPLCQPTPYPFTRLNLCIQDSKYMCSWTYKTFAALRSACIIGGSERCRYRMPDQQPLQHGFNFRMYPRLIPCTKSRRKLIANSPSKGTVSLWRRS